MIPISGPWFVFAFVFFLSFLKSKSLCDLRFYFQLCFIELDRVGKQKQKAKRTNQHLLKICLISNWMPPRWIPFPSFFSLNSTHTHPAGYSTTANFQMSGREEIFYFAFCYWALIPFCSSRSFLLVYSVCHFSLFFFMKIIALLWHALYINPFPFKRSLRIYVHCWPAFFH